MNQNTEITLNNIAVAGCTACKDGIFNAVTELVESKEARSTNAACQMVAKAINGQIGEEIYTSERIRRIYYRGRDERLPEERKTVSNDTTLDNSTEAPFTPVFTDGPPPELNEDNPAVNPNGEDLTVSLGSIPDSPEEPTGTPNVSNPWEQPSENINSTGSEALTEDFTEDGCQSTSLSENSSERSPVHSDTPENIFTDMEEKQEDATSATAKHDRLIQRKKDAANPDVVCQKARKQIAGILKALKACPDIETGTDSKALQRNLLAALKESRGNRTDKVVWAQIEEALELVE